MYNPTILSVLAHPDDESFGMGGTLALYARQGVSVHLVCATRGEAGEVEPDYLQGFESIAELRESELRCAAGILGLKSVHFLGYRDSGMQGTPANQHPEALVNAPLGEVTAKITHLIREIKPQVVLTFDPIGGYRHPDHIAIHKATVQAFELAGDPSFSSDGFPAYQPQKLYYHTIPRGWLKLLVKIMPLYGKDPSKWGRNGDINLAELAKDDYPIHAVINYKSVTDFKEKASACHASQGGGGISLGIIGWLLRLRGHHDQFMRAYPPPNGKRVEKDLFDGIKPTAETQEKVA
jgi:LmbE family N-acetylglucosaminyl deacetylase